MNEQKYDTIVVGGGISGISFAHLAGRAGKKALVVEKNAVAGGQIRSLPIEGSDFWCEMGSHTCYNSYVALLSMLGDLKSLDSVLPIRNFSYNTYHHGRIRSIFSELAIPQLLWSAIRNRKAVKEGKSVREYFRPLVGARNYDHLFSKAFRAVICQDADLYPSALLMKKRATRMKEIARRFTFRGGLSAMIRTIADSGLFEMRTGTEIKAVNLTNVAGKPVYELNTADGDTLRASTVALAVDTQSAAVLLRGLEPEIADLLATISLFPSRSLSVVLPARFRMKSMAGLISLDDDFMSMVSRDVLPHNDYRGFSFHFKETTPEEKMMDIVYGVLSINQSDILAQSRMAHVLPALRTSHTGMAQRIEAVRRHPELCILGNFFGGVSLEDCVLRARDEWTRCSALI